MKKKIFKHKFYIYIHIINIIKNKMNCNEDNDYICIVLGETGVGKSSFINGITNKQEACKVSNSARACTTKFKIVSTAHDNSRFHFIDTPGLNDAKGDEKNINEIKTGLSDYPKFRCIIILLKFQEMRLKAPDITSLKNFMQCFPSKSFWDHVFIVRTHADTSAKKFKKEKAKVEGKIVESINDEEEKAFIDFKNFMRRKKIELPTSIDEFYVDNDNEDEDNYENNKIEYNKIFNKIKQIRPMFKNVTKSEYERVETEGLKFPVKQTWRKIQYIDYEDNKTSTSPYISYELEVANYKIVARRKRKEVLETESECGDVRIKYQYYETCIYDVDGKQVEGKECSKGTGWE